MNPDNRKAMFAKNNPKIIRKAMVDSRFNDVMDLAYRINQAKTRQDWKKLGRDLKVYGNYFSYESKSESQFKNYQDEVN